MRLSTEGLLFYIYCLPEKMNIYMDLNPLKKIHTSFMQKKTPPVPALPSFQAKLYRSVSLKKIKPADTLTPGAKPPHREYVD